MSRVTVGYLAMLLLLGLVEAAPTSSRKGMSRGMKMGMNKRMMIRKTKDLPIYRKDRYRTKHAPHALWKGDPSLKGSSSKDAVQENEDKAITEDEDEIPVDVGPNGEREEEEEPKETARKLQNNKKRKNGGDGQNFQRRQGVDRAAERQAARGGGADDTAFSDGQQQRADVQRARAAGVPMMDWSWGTVWMDDSLNARAGGNGGGGGGGGQRTADRPPPPAGQGGGRGRGNNAGRGAGRGANNGNGGGGGGGGGNRQGGNPFAGEEEWRKQFVSRLTPRPTRPPVPNPTPRPTKRPTPEPYKDAGGGQTDYAKADTPKPTPSPTPKADPNEDRGNCQLCPNGAAAAHMSKTLIATSIKCQDIANSLAMADAADCPMQKSKLPVNIEAYCGCPGANQAPKSCKFCADGSDNIWHNISIPALNDWTCQDVDDYCDFITNTQACEEMKPIAELCCGTWEEYWAYGDDDWTDDTTRTR